MTSGYEPGDPRLPQDPGQPIPAAGDWVPRDVTQESVGSLISDVAGDLSKLMRQELELARAELRADAIKAGKAGALLGGSGLAGWMVALFGSLATVWALADVMHLGWAALIVTAAWALVGVVLFVAGRNRLRQVNAVPEQTLQSLKEDKEWITGQTN